MSVKENSPIENIIFYADTLYQHKTYIKYMFNVNFFKMYFYKYDLYNCLRYI